MLKKKLHNNELTLGSWVTIGDESIVEIIAKSGYDWLVIDLEHSSIDIQTAAKLIRIIDLCNVTPLVRLTSNNPDQIKRVMDAGVYGIVVPMVNSRKQAEQAVASTRYGPKGIRGVGLARAQGYGNKFKEYLKWQRDEPIVIVQIEHKDAINNLEEIFTTPGVDGFIIGPYDLSCSLGIPGEFNNKEFIDTVNYIKSIGEKFNCSVGMHIVEPDSSILSKCIDDGYKFIAYSVDIRVIDVGFRLGASYIAR